MSFCNQVNTPDFSLGLLNVEAETFEWLGAGRQRGLSGATGVLAHGNFIWVLLQCDDGSALGCYSLDNFECASLYRFRFVRDAHDLCRNGDLLFVTSTGTNEIYSLRIEGSRVLDEQLHWRSTLASGNQRDEVHLNSLTTDGDRLIATCFGTKHGDAWGNDGLVFEVATGRALMEGLSHPHSGGILDGVPYCCDSLTGRLLFADGIAVDIRGYPRGICVLSEKILVASSAMRTRSRSKGTIEIRPDDAAGQRHSRLFVLDRQRREVERILDLTSLGLEIYAITALDQRPNVERTVDARGARAAALEEKSYRQAELIGTLVSERDAWAQEGNNLKASLARSDDRIAPLLDELRESVKHGNVLAHSVSQRDAELAELRRTLDAREHRLAETAMALAKREQELAEASAAVRDREQVLAETSAALRDREQQLAETSAALRDREQQLAETSAALRDREQQLAETSAALGNREQRLAEMRLEVDHKDSQIQELSGAATTAESRLREEKNRTQRTVQHAEQQLTDARNRYASAEKRERSEQFAVALARRQEANARQRAALLWRERQGLLTANSALTVRGESLEAQCATLQGSESDAKRRFEEQSTIAGWLRARATAGRQRLVEAVANRSVAANGSRRDGRRPGHESSDTRERQARPTPGAPYAIEYIAQRPTFFDADFYAEQIPDLIGADPIHHYCTEGVALGLDPHPLFDTSFYVDANPDLARLGLNPFVHFLTQGFTEGRNPHPLFDLQHCRQGFGAVLGDTNPWIAYLENPASCAPHPLFDSQGYLARYPDVVAAGINPLVHYLRWGAAEGRNPHALFDVGYYLEENHDVAERGANPLAHYVLHGARECRKPNALFDPAFYSHQAALRAEENPLAHYITCGAKRALNPHPLFDAAFYSSRYPDVADAKHEPLAHFLEFGAAELRQPHPLFDPCYYRERYAEFLTYDEKPIFHYLQPDAADHFQPSPLFDPEYYLRCYPDVAENGENPLLHYLRCGASEGRSPHPLFDTQYYLTQYRDVAASGVNPLAHYLANGAREGRYPNPLFDTVFYQRQVPDVPIESALAHYLKHGASAELDPHPLFDSSFYLETNSDVAREGRNPLEHFLTSGAQEGRSAHPLFDTRFYQERHPELWQTGVNALAAYLEDPARRADATHPLFDGAYYLENNPDLSLRGAAPLLHYVLHGGSEGRKPHPLFDGQYYLQTHADIRQAGVNPLVHFLTAGAREGRDPHPLFSTRYYAEQATDMGSQNPLIHYCQNGAARLLNPHPLFDAKYLVERCPDAAANPLLHFVALGAEAPSPHPLFDSDYYRAHESSARTAATSGLEHYMLSGSQANPHPLFDTAHYLGGSADVAKARTNPLLHYVLFGSREDRSPHPLFDCMFYRAKYPDAASSGLAALVHYLRVGARAGYQPNAHFDSEYFQDWSRRCGFIVPPGLEACLGGSRPSSTSEIDALVTRLNEKPRRTGKQTVPITVFVLPARNIMDRLRCLDALTSHEAAHPFDIVVLDDGGAEEVLSRIRAIRYCKMGPKVSICNAVAKRTRAPFAVLVSGTSMVMPGWLAALAQTFEDFPDAGAAGSMLLYPWGQLREAGRISSSTGMGEVCGQGDDRNRPEYNYVRGVQSVSAASVMCRREVIEQATREAATDASSPELSIARASAACGYRVMFQPLSAIVDTEPPFGVRQRPQQVPGEAATAPSSGVDPGTAIGAAPTRMRMLVLDACTPTPDQDAGSLRVYNYLRVFRSWGYAITFIPVDNFLRMERYTADLQRLGIECIYWPYEGSVDHHLAGSGDRYDVVYLSRFNAGGVHLESVRRHCPSARLVFDTADLHHLRELRRAALESSPELHRIAMQYKDRELHIVRNSDITLVVSEFEKAVLAKETPDASVDVVPMALTVPGRRATFEQRDGICFIGGYQHTPNVDAVTFFVGEIWPLVKEKLPSVRFYVIGSRPPPALTALSGEDIIVTGQVADLGVYLDRCRLQVVPLRYGAGIKGKIGSSLSYGVPSVATSIAAEGMGLTAGENIAVADEPTAFADEVVRLYRNPQLWYGLSDAGLKFVRDNHSIDAAAAVLARVLTRVAAKPFYGACSRCGTTGPLRAPTPMSVPNPLCLQCAEAPKSRKSLSSAEQRLN